MFAGLQGNDVSSLVLHLELEAMFAKDIPTDLAIYSTPRKKHTQINEGPNVFKKKSSCDCCCVPEHKKSPRSAYFGDDGKGHANTAKVSKVKLRHHTKKGTVWKKTSLYITFAIGN